MGLNDEVLNELDNDVEDGDVVVEIPDTDTDAVVEGDFVSKMQSIFAAMMESKAKVKLVDDLTTTVTNMSEIADELVNNKAVSKSSMLVIESLIDNFETPAPINSYTKQPSRVNFDDTVLAVNYALAQESESTDKIIRTLITEDAARYQMELMYLLEYKLPEVRTLVKDVSGQCLDLLEKISVSKDLIVPTEVDGVSEFLDITKIDFFDDRVLHVQLEKLNLETVTDAVVSIRDTISLHPAVKNYLLLLNSGGTIDLNEPLPSVESNGDVTIGLLELLRVFNGDGVSIFVDNLDVEISKILTQYDALLEEKSLVELHKFFDRCERLVLSCNMLVRLAVATDKLVGEVERLC